MDAAAAAQSWQQSRGANLEAWIALDLDLPVLDLRNGHGHLGLRPVLNPTPFALPFDAPEAVMTAAWGRGILWPWNPPATRC